MNVFSILALTLGIFAHLACKQTDEKSEQMPTSAQTEEVEKVSLRALENKPQVAAYDLKIEDLSISVHSIGSYKAAMVAFYAQKDVAEYYQYEFCHQESEDECIKGWYHNSHFIVVGLKPGTHKFNINACIRKEKAASEQCGSTVETYYQQPQNEEGELATNILRYFSFLPDTQNISFAVFNALLLYKQQLKEAGHEAPKDDLEIAIDNVLELGPHQNASYYLDDSFDLVRDSILEQQSNASASLSLTEKNYEKFDSNYDKYHKPDPNEPSTFGKIMILAGAASVFTGFVKLLNSYEMSPQEKKRRYEEYFKRNKKYYNQEVLDELDKQAKLFNDGKAFEKKKLQKFKTGTRLLGIGALIFAVGFGTRANLVEDPNSIGSIRRSLQIKLEKLESDLFQIIRERKALLEEIPF